MPGRMAVVCVMSALACGSAVTQAEEIRAMRGFEGEGWSAQRSYEQGLIEGVRTDRLSDFHGALSGVPHPAGSDGDRRVIEWISDRFEEWGLEVEEHWIEVYVSRPVVGEVEVVRDGTGEVSIALSVKEGPIEGDPYLTDPNLDIGWSAYSGSGEVVAPVVYANYGRKQDFEQLREMGVDVSGKIVIARFGGNYRGYKAKFAEEHGAAGLIMYTDPEDAGYVRGVMYPDGGWATPEKIQRGSVLTLDYAGDPLTPGVSAEGDVERLDPEEVDFPRIPVQPIGWGAAEKILSRMEGGAVPESWQGGLPFNYRVEGGDALRVRLKVEQERGLAETASVVGMVRGERWADEWVIVGAHHDAWTHGAGDPNAGTMIVMELARVFAERARAGERPARSVLFACWGAEEYGIIGSTEWIEKHAAHLGAHAVSYMNLDMAAMGMNFGASASPSLHRLVEESAKVVGMPGEDGRSVHDAWRERNGGEVRVGVLGGGSDHVPFLMHAGVSSISMGAWGSKGVSYHSTYDNLHWYRRVVGDDYEPGAMVARVAAVVLSRLANADVLWMEMGAYADVVEVQIGELEKMAVQRGMEMDGSEVRARLDGLRAAGEQVLNGGGVSAREVNRALLEAERVWVSGPAPAKRAWYRNRFVASDRYSGYASWVLPQVRGAIEDGDQALLEAEVRRLAVCLERMRRVLEGAMAR